MSAKLQARFDEAYSQHERGQLDRAEMGYKTILKKDPCHAPSLYMLGLAAYQRKQYKQAVRYYRQVTDLTPYDADAHFELGNSLYKMELKGEALSCMDRAIELNPHNADFFCNRGLILKDIGRYDEAIASYSRALEINPNDAEVWFNLGNAQSKNTEYSEALKSYAHALKITPNNHDIWHRSGHALRELFQYPAALHAYEKAISLAPTDPKPYCGAAHACTSLNQIEKAFEYCDKASTLASCDDTELQATLLEARGLIMFQLNQPDKAEQLFRAAIRISPKKTSPTIGFNLSRALLIQGNDSEGWSTYDNRLAIKKYHLPASPSWDGQESLQGKRILLLQEQGQGDMIQFCRYAPLLAKQGARVTIEAPSSLVRLFSSLGANIEIIPQGSQWPEHDLHLPLLSLPRHMGVAADNPYLFADEVDVQHWATKLGPHNKPRIGLVWSGNPNYQNDQQRSIPLSTLMPIFKTIDADWYNLQKEIRTRDKEALQQSPLINETNNLNDFADTAALIMQLDLVISVDTAVAHLAATLGKPVWILLPFTPDFRWQLERSDSPWYPTAKLFRQNQTGDWLTVLEHIHQVLQNTSFAKQ